MLTMAILYCTQAEASRLSSLKDAKDSYEKAVEKRLAQDKVAPSFGKKKVVEPVEFEEDIDPDLAASLQRARRLAQLKVRIAVQVVGTWGWCCQIVMICICDRSRGTSDGDC